MSHMWFLFAPEGRLTIAQGVSPGKRNPNRSLSPGGAEEFAAAVLYRPSGAPGVVCSCFCPTACAVGYILTPLRGFISDKVYFFEPTPVRPERSAAKSREAYPEPRLVKIGDSGIVFLVLTLTAFVPGACSFPGGARGRGEQFRSRHGLGEGNKNRISSYYQPHRIFITPP
jgi:hypothetical protein